MTFAHPWVLLLLAVPVLLAWVVLIGRRPGVVMPFDHRPHRRSRVLRLLLGVFEVSPLALAGVAIIMLAGPMALRQPKDERLLSNIEICLDVSGSMWGDRYRMAAEAVEEFTKDREGDAFGLTMFGSQQIRWIPLTKDLGAIRSAMPFANPDNQPPHMNGTMIAAALRFCRDNMVAEAMEGDRLIIMVSDGQSPDLRGGEYERVAAELREENITLYHIHVASADSIPTEVVDMAQLTGGQAMAAENAETIREVFRHIDKMEPARYKTAGVQLMDNFAPFATIVLVLAGVHMCGLLGMRYTPW